MRKVLYILGILSDDDVEWLINVGSKQRLVVGKSLIERNGSVSALYIVLDGQLSVRAMQSEREHEVAQIGSGEIVGEMSFIDSRPPSATVSALTDSLVLSIPRRLLLDKLEQDTGFAARFYHALAVFLADRLRGMDNNLGYGKMELASAAIDDDELDATLLDNVYQAGSRFDRLLKRLMSS